MWRLRTTGAWCIAPDQPVVPGTISRDAEFRGLGRPFPALRRWLPTSVSSWTQDLEKWDWSTLARVWHTSKPLSTSSTWSSLAPSSVKDSNTGDQYCTENTGSEVRNETTQDSQVRDHVTIRETTPIKIEQFRGNSPKCMVRESHWAEN